MTGYLDTNIIVEVENQTQTLEQIRNLSIPKIEKFFYSMSHIHEANEISGNSNKQLKIRLNKRFSTITKITNNNYLDRILPSNEVVKIKRNPEKVYKSINHVPGGKEAMKKMVNTTSEEKKQELRKQLEIDPLRINNYSPEEVLQKINDNKRAFGGYTLKEFIEKGVEMHPNGNEMSLHNRFAGVFEILDLVGFWKDKFNEKSNYARLWDSSHAYFSSFCDYFISDDKRTRNKTKVVFELYDIDTQVISSNENNQ